MTAYAERKVAPVPGLDEGIATWVEILRKHGVETFESCEGGDGHAFDRPTIRFFGGPDAGYHAYAVARVHALPVSELQRYWSEQDGELVGPQWQLVFWRSAAAPVSTEKAPT